MRRWLAVAALGAALLLMPAWAQRRGGGFAGHAGFASRGSMGYLRVPTMANRGPMMARPSRGFIGARRNNISLCIGCNRFGFNRSFHHGFHHHRFGPWWYGYPYWGYPYWDYGFWDYDSSPSYDQSAYYAYDQANQIASMQQQGEIDRLRDEVERLREQRPAPQASQMSSSQPQSRLQSESEPTRLVFRDKRTEDVNNYAIVGQTLWIFTEQRAKKVSLAELDIPATRKVNEDRGIEFELPR